MKSALSILIILSLLGSSVYGFDTHAEIRDEKPSDKAVIRIVHNLAETEFWFFWCEPILPTANPANPNDYKCKFMGPRGANPYTIQEIDLEAEESLKKGYIAIAAWLAFILVTNRIFKRKAVIQTPGATTTILGKTTTLQSGGYAATTSMGRISITLNKAAQTAEAGIKAEKLVEQSLNSAQGLTKVLTWMQNVPGLGIAVGVLTASTTTWFTKVLNPVNPGYHIKRNNALDMKYYLKNKIIFRDVEEHGETLNKLLRDIDQRTTAHKEDLLKRSR